MTRDEVLALARQVGVKAEWVEATLLPSVALLDAVSTPTRSWLGGAPELPAELEWPTWDADAYLVAQQASLLQMLGRNAGLPVWQERLAKLEAARGQGPQPLAFYAQIDLAEVHAAVALPHLPATGILSFFFDWEHGAGSGSLTLDPAPWQVHWFPDAAALQARALPAESQPFIDKAPMRAAAAWSIPEMILDGEEFVYSPFEEPYRSFVKEMERRLQIRGNQVGGHPYAIQLRDPRVEVVLRESGAWSNARNHAYHQAEKHVEPWKLLLQITTDYRPMSFAIAGSTTFWRQDGAWTPGLQSGVQQHYTGT